MFELENMHIAFTDMDLMKKILLYQKKKKKIILDYSKNICSLSFLKSTKMRFKMQKKKRKHKLFLIL